MSNEPTCSKTPPGVARRGGNQATRPRTEATPEHRFARGTVRRDRRPPRRVLRTGSRCDERRRTHHQPRRIRSLFRNYPSSGPSVGPLTRPPQRPLRTYVRNERRSYCPSSFCTREQREHRLIQSPHTSDAPIAVGSRRGRRREKAFSGRRSPHWRRTRGVPRGGI